MSDPRPLARGELLFREVFDTQLSFVWRVVRYCGIRGAEVEDVAQEVFIVVHRQLADVAVHGGSLRSWLYAITWRVASGWRRRAVRRREVLTAEPQAGAGPDDPGRDAEYAELATALERVLDELDEDKRLVFVLYEVEQLPMREITDAMGCPLQTGYSRLRAAREHVRAVFDAERR